MSESATGAEWVELEGNDGLTYIRHGVLVRVRGRKWWAYEDSELKSDNLVADHATAKQQAERWILEREGRLPAPATDGGGWIACSERPVEYKVPIEIRGEIQSYGTGIKLTHWRPLPVDPHAVAACLFGDDRPTLAQARAATLHVAGCGACRAKLEAKGEA